MPAIRNPGTLELSRGGRGPTGCRGSAAQCGTGYVYDRCTLSTQQIIDWTGIAGVTPSPTVCCDGA